MTTVWYVGSANSRTLSEGDWEGYGIVADSITWSAANGWSVPTNVFSVDQISVLSSDSSFLLGQSGPRINRVVSGTDAEVSALVYAQRVQAIYDQIMAGSPISWDEILSKPAVVADGDLAGLGVTMELYQDFTKGDVSAIPTVADSGQEWTRTAIDWPAGKPKFTGTGWDCSTEAPGVLAGYLTGQLSDTVTFMFACFEMDTSGTTHAQVACTIAWAVDLPSDAALGAVPDSPCHLIWGYNQGSYQTYRDGVHADVAPIPYPSILGAGPQYVFVAIDKDQKTAYVVDPTGKITEVTHDDIGISANFACAEVFYLNGDTDDHITYRSFGASPVKIESTDGKSTDSPGGLFKRIYKAITGALKFPQISYVRDILSGAPILNFIGQANAVNYTNISNAADGAYPIFQADGSSADVGWSFRVKGLAFYQWFQQAGSQVHWMADGVAGAVGWLFETKGGAPVEFNAPVKLDAEVTRGTARFAAVDKIYHNDTATLTVGINDQLISLDVAAVITMPDAAAAHVNSIKYQFVNVTGGTARTLTAQSGQFFLDGPGGVFGASTYVVPAAGYVTFIAVGTNWFRVG